MEQASLILAASAAAAVMVVGVTVWLGEQRSSLHRSFVLLALFMCAWIMTNVAFRAVDDSEVQFTVALISYFFAMCVAIQLYVFSLFFADKSISTLRKVIIGLGYITAGVTSLPGVVGLGVQDGRIITSGLSLALYGALLVGFLAASCLVLIAYRQSMVMKRKHYINIIFAGMAISSIFGATFNLLLPLYDVYDYILLGPSSTVIFMAMIAYAIVRHGLFDIRLAVVRTTAYALSLATLIVIYYSLIIFASEIFYGQVASVTESTISAALVLILAFLFQPIKQFFDRWTNRLFYRDNYNSSEFFARISGDLTTTTNLRSLLQRSSDEIAKTIKAEYALFYVYLQDGRHMSVGTKSHIRLPVADMRSLDELTDNELIVTDSLDSHSDLYRLLASHRIAILMPLKRGKVTVGYLFLGHQRARNYTRRDIKVLETIRNELVIAIQNSLSVHEVKELNATLQQRVNTATKELRHTNARLRQMDATKDEFISMASHQLRTPLTSIKGYLSMVLEGDVGKVPDSQKQLLQEAFSSSERMVHLIGDFLNVSRLQTGKFMVDRRTTSLDRVVNQEIENLKRAAEGRELALKYKPPTNFPTLMIDEGKIRQVVMNFLDNAIYYSLPKTTIRVELLIDENYVKFSVTDQGIGVPISEQEGLFGKFYRASNARRQRPDGTGVGLFLAKKVIDAHEGEVIFESTEGKGSTFGFILPVKVAANND